MDGLNLAGEAFGKKFKVTRPGMKRAHWAHNSESLDEKTVCGSSAMKLLPSDVAEINYVQHRSLSVDGRLQETGQKVSRLS